MDAVGDLPLPHPSAAQLVAVTAFVQQHIAGLKLKPPDGGLRHANLGHRTNTEVTPRDTGAAQTRHKRQSRIRLLLRRLRSSANNVGDFTKRRPGPTVWD